MPDTSPIPRPEHPKPQFERSSWQNLNGQWTFAFDHGKSGRHKGWDRSTGFADTILVPFCPESRLSGVGHTDFIEAMWYHRTLSIPPDWSGKRILLHFGGVDWECEAFVDGRSVGEHFGGTVSFCLDITGCVTAGKTHNLVVHVRDEVRSGSQPSGKQSQALVSAGCHYTRTTGIWQTVWLEAVDPCGLRDVHIVPDLDAGRFVIVPSFHSVKQGNLLKVTLSQGGAKVTAPAQDGVPITVPITKPRPWSPADPFLYDIRLEVTAADGQVIDSIKSYAGLRKVHCEGDHIFLNNEPLYLRFVLDQGFYPEGIWTAPSDSDLKRDVELSMAAGFNGARLHQKVFEERFHYWADKLGYLTWGESASWGFDMEQAEGARNFLSEWREIVVRDRNHPSIIAWTPFNETGTQVDKTRHDRRLVQETYGLTKALDPTRRVNDCSGWVHVKTDLWTVHDYAQDRESLLSNLKRDATNGVMRNKPQLEPPYEGQPYLIDEFGGIKWIPPGRRPNADNSWGYGDAPKTEEEFCKRLQTLIEAIHACEHVRGYCYTQLTDVEQEQNGIYNYDRTAKFDTNRLHAIFAAGNPTL
jgi:beta-galactosidase/beta-glucuronidase